MPGQVFKHLKDIFLLYKGHFTVYLCKLRLPVGPEIFIPEALYDLEIPVHSAHHKQLLKCLRRLRKGIELSFVHAGRHHKVTRTFGGRLDEVWGFHFYETLLRKVLAYLHGHRSEEHTSEL